MAPAEVGCTPEQAAGARPGHHQLRHAAAQSPCAGSHRLAFRDPRRGAGDQEPGAQQTRAVKKLKARARIALTGTPVENRLGDLWSIFDFINPGLLGTAQGISRAIVSGSRAAADPYGPLRALVQPYILRRLKTDKSVIADLPDKTEVKAYCNLSRSQAALYQQAVADLAEQLERADGIERAKASCWRR